MHRSIMCALLQICSNYIWHMRDDYALSHYGFVPDQETPPRLLMVDHHLFYSDIKVEDQAFEGEQLACLGDDN